MCISCVLDLFSELNELKKKLSIIYTYLKVDLQNINRFQLLLQIL